MGCGNSTPSSPTLPSRTLPSSTPQPTVAITPVLRSPSPTPPPSPILILPKKTTPIIKKTKVPVKIAEDFVIVWLNPTADSDPDTQEIQEELQKLVNVVLTFTDPEECHDFIDGVKDEKVFLIVSGTLAEQFAETVQETPQIDSIYCLSSDEEASNTQISNNPRVVGVFTSAPPLCKQVKEAVKMCAHNLVKPIVVRTKPDRIQFMYDQLFREIILTSKEEDLGVFYQFCEDNYSNNNDAKKYLFELRNSYSKESSILWYTKEGCLYHVLNKALRTRDYEILYELRHFTRHLYEKIVDQLNETEKEIPTLYRGQVMETAEFDRISANKGGPTYFPNFMSTSTHHAIAMGFIKTSVAKPGNKGKVKVLFEIKVDKNVYFPFADVSRLSDYVDEGEWLFSMGSVFRIEAIEEQPDKVQRVRLISMNDNDEQLMILKEHIQNFVKDENICLSFARLMHQLADWKGSKKFYEKSLETKNEPHREAGILNNLGSVVSQLGDYDKALNYYNQSLELEQKEKNPDRRDLASTYNNIGTLYYEKKEIDIAVENFRKAIEAYNDAPIADLEIVATIYNNIANVLNHQGKHQKALVNNERCVGIRETILPSLHPSLATAYNSMANTYYYLCHFSQRKELDSEVNEYAQKALDYAAKAVIINNQALPSDHPQTKMHKANLERFTPEGTNSEQ